MRKLLLALITLLTFSLASEAQNYCLTAPFGYGRNVTGGAGGSIVLVSSVSDLQTALKSSGSKIIIITSNLNVTSLMKVKVTNKTLLALPGVTLSNTKTPTSESDAKSNTGILYLQSGSDNVIIRNLTFIGPGAFDCEGNDGLCFDGVTNVWVDHCDFQDGIDGNFDMKSATDNITVTWCRFHYLKSPKAASSWTSDGGTDDHRFTDLIGSSKTDKPSNRRVTFAYNWWDQGCVERMPRSRHSQFHFLNNYWSSTVAKVCLGLGGCTAYVEGCYFTQKKSVIYKDYSSNDGASGNNLKFVNSYGGTDGLPSNAGSASAPTYTYPTPHSYTDAKTYVTNASCGAGATLIVDTDGNVSSPCDAADPTITLFSAATTAEQNVQEGDAITSIVYTYGGSANAFEITYKANGSTVSRPSWLTATTSGNKVTFSGTPTTIGSANTTYTIHINSTDGSSDSEILTATIAVTPLTPGTLVKTSGSNTQTIYKDQPISNIVYTYGGGATGATVTGLPSGVEYTIDASGRITISGTATVAGTYNYTVSTTGGSSQTSLTGTITVNNPTTLAMPSATYTTSGSTANVSWAAVPNASSYNVQVCSSSGAAGTTTNTWDMASIYTASSGSIASSSTFSGLSVVPKDGTPITVESNSKTFSDGYSGTYRLKTGGASAMSGSTPTNRYMSFSVDGPSKITVWFISGGSSERTLTISDGTDDLGFATSSSSSDPKIATGVYTGAGGTIYIYVDASINIYKVAVEPKATESCNIYNTTSTTYDATISGTSTISVQAVGNGIGYMSSEYAAAVEASVPVGATLALSSTSANATTFESSAITNITYTYTGIPTITWTGTASSSTAPAGVSVSTSDGVITISGAPTTAGTYGYSINVAAISGGTPASANGSGTITVNSAEDLAEPTATYTVDGATASVSWSAVAGASSYNVQVCTGSGGSNQTIGFSEFEIAAYANTGAVLSSTLAIVNTSKTVSIESGSGTAGGESYTKYCKLGGGGSTTNCALKVTLDGSGTLTVYSNAADNGRITAIANSSGTVLTDGTSSNTNTVEISSAGDYYIYSTGSSMNIYMIIFESDASCKETVVNGTSVDVAYSTGNVISVQAVGDGIRYNSSDYAVATEATTPIAANVTLTSAASTNAQTITKTESISNITYTYTGNATITWTGTDSETTAPDGITVTAADGNISISGTPTTEGTYGYTIAATAINGGTPANDSKSGTITVNALPAPVISTTSTTTQSITIGDAISSITYNSDIAANWTVTGLPSGVTYEVAGNNKSITISGTPSAIATSNFTVKAANPSDASKFDTANGTITVSAASCGKLVTFNLNVAPAGSYRLKLYNGGGSVVATIFSGSLAEGKCSIITNVSAISAGSYTYKLVDGSDNVINSQTGAVTIP